MRDIPSSHNLSCLIRLQAQELVTKSLYKHLEMRKQSLFNKHKLLEEISTLKIKITIDQVEEHSTVENFLMQKCISKAKEEVVEIHKHQIQV